MKTAPGSYVAIDPGRIMGFAYCLAGGENLRHGTWKFQAPRPGAAYAEFTVRLKELLKSLPRPLVGIELMTIVAHDGPYGSNHVDANQVRFSSGWPTHAETLCYSLGLEDPVYYAIQTWRSKTHGVTRTPKDASMSLAERSKFFKQAAVNYCERSGWTYNSADEAEALCILDAMRIEFEPNYAFDKGRAYQQEDMFA